ncbi:MAG TPA: aldo/keto reductase [Candidatus Saccharimonadales bacterium]|nr:aldo/keto reductase [Candidatus Saccharimonadales bacterium]
MLSGSATPAGTAGCMSRFTGSVSGDHFTQHGGLWLSSIGLGTYLGEPTEEDDAAYEAAIRAAVGSGCNVIDTAINYRFQRSERCIGKALGDLVAAGDLRRSEIVVATKGGFIPFDGGYPSDPGAWVVDNLVLPGVIEVDEIVAECHCMSPAYIDLQLETSLKNLSLERVDIYYLHNPETQLAATGREEFLRRLTAAFTLLERKAAAGKLTLYGTATWDGFRRAPGSPDHLELAEILEAAESAAEAAGSARHHFGAIQLPLNLAMPEALIAPTQRIRGGGRRAPLLEAAHEAGLLVMGSASILQGHLPPRIPAEIAKRIPGGSSAVHKAIQWARSAPGLCTALVGMKSAEHALENMALATDPRMSPDQHAALISRRD